MFHTIGWFGEQFLSIRCIAFLVLDLGEPCHFRSHVSLDFESRGYRNGLPLCHLSGELLIDPE
jgi:hypothetical protein